MPKPMDYWHECCYKHPMTIAQIIVAYSVCWWLVLFMVLPHQAEASKNPQTGNAPSAPANPQIKKKCIWTTFIAILPTILVYFAAENAKAAEDDSIYHASSHGCHKSANYKAPADISTKDGTGVNGKTVTPADLPGGSDAYKGDIDIPLALPSQKYTDPTKHNVDLSQSFIGAGKLTVTKDGDTLLNGKPIVNNQADSGDCDGDK
jgi:predicted secreted protein